MICYLSEQAVGLYREKENRYPLSLQQGEVANTNARSDGRSVYTNKCCLTGGAFTQTTLSARGEGGNWAGPSLSLGCKYWAAFYMLVLLSRNLS
jgi:hypothetical protein